MDESPDSSSTGTPSRVEKYKAIAARAAQQSAVPLVLRDARDSFAAFEDRAVKAFLKYAGRLGEQRAVQSLARTRRSDSYMDMTALNEYLGRNSVRFSAGRLKFHFDGLITDLFANPKKTAIWSAYEDTIAREGPYAILVFNWPRVKHCRGWCVFLESDRCDNADLTKGAFRIALPINGSTYIIEPLPTLLKIMGYGLTEDDEIPE